MTQVLSKDLSDLLESALNEKIESFDLQIEGNDNGEGHLGEVLFITLTNKSTNKIDHVVVKQVLESSVENTIDFMSSTFLNEIHFYGKFLPALQEFQRSYPGAEIFNHVPKCLGTCLERGKEKLILENLKFRNFTLHPKKEYVGYKMYEAIFKTYGKYHGACLAFKHNQPEKFLELSNGFQNNFKKMVKTGLLERGILGMSAMVQSTLKETQPELYEKFTPFAEKSVEKFLNCLDYRSPYSVITHGDCWSNNMMFKINESGTIEDIQLIDFQMSWLGTPVMDLTYSFYASTGKENLEKLDDLLKEYHDSLSETLKSYNCDVEKIFPFHALKKEWKEYSAFGSLMGLLLWLHKTRELKEVPNIGEIMDRSNDEQSKPDKKQDLGIEFDHAFFYRSTLPIIKHMCDNDFL
ncbi:uncharacterized protein LOC114328721 [Diabrotica virgifera virgifera]|uniref:Uncharacterized protein LOC114328721 n=1 Tax=Diabrotica virgifera virgifera TaxID=50390 RepID=A0A6P7FJW5_DIAVI|nr:uncharacterized protein LOC114328721 [Diabrotica virgifera virgifera]